MTRRYLLCPSDFHFWAGRLVSISAPKRPVAIGLVFSLLAVLVMVRSAQAQQDQAPMVMDPTLAVRTAVSGLDMPTTMAFLGPDQFLVLEKASGRVQHVVGGAIRNTAITLPVNNASERGLLGIALDPHFGTKHRVYLYWTQSQSGRISSDTADVPLLGNRVDRFVWDPATQTLAIERNLITLHAFQADAGQPLRGNHNGGVIRFGPDGKLYIIIGDNGRRGALQNLPSGPTPTGHGPRIPDDQFGGPLPDDAHRTGVVLRLNTDGSAPPDNPFFRLGASVRGQVGPNLQKIFAYGIRNSFGLAFDPITGRLWESENGDDAFDELNHISAGHDGGWIQVMGPISRVLQFKTIESTFIASQHPEFPFSPQDAASFIPSLQQLRWPPSNIAATPQQARSRLFLLPGAHYADPEFSWRFAVAPAGIGFVNGNGLGAKYRGDLLVGEARTFLDNGYLFDFKFTPDREHFRFSDPRLRDRVADNNAKFDGTESESLLLGKNFGIVTDIQTAPDGTVYVVSLSNGAVYQILPAANTMGSP